MTIAITGTTGQVGGAVARQLVARGVRVRLLVRDPARLPAGLAQPTHALEHRVGDHLDPAFVAEALRGCDQLFWMTPMALTDDIAAFYARAGDAAETAAHVVSRAGGRIVDLSGAYCDRPGVGLAGGIRLVERALEASIHSVRHLRAGLFMENYFFQLPLIRAQGLTVQPVSPDASASFIATADIATAAVTALLDPHWAGRSAAGVMGPERLSFRDAATIVSRETGVALRFEQVPGPAMAESLVAQGMPGAFARAYVEMYEAFDRFLTALDDPAEPIYLGRTTLAEFARTTLAPALRP